MEEPTFEHGELRKAAREESFQSSAITSMFFLKYKVPPNDAPVNPTARLDLFLLTLKAYFANSLRKLQTQENLT
jgi:hypothetical protein